MEQKAWHHLSTDTCLRMLRANKWGLGRDEVAHRIDKFGVNLIPSNIASSALKRLSNQFHNILIYILLMAAFITGLFNHWLDCAVILSVVILNAIIGVIQEGNAEKSIESLKKMLPLKATVKRDSHQQLIDASALVPGDIVVLKIGDKVPADLRLIDVNALQVDEAILTGESMPVDKHSQAVPVDCSLSERSSMVYSGTYVINGCAEGVVVSTGVFTEIGRISSMLSDKPPILTPLTLQIERFGRRLALFIVSLSLFILVFGLIVRNYPLDEIFMASVAIAVSIIPEGLPAIITITLAIGVMRMASQKAIVRRLASVETLSSVSTICTDKTGTLTKNELTVKKIRTLSNIFEVSGVGYNNEGEILLDNEAIDLNAQHTLLHLIQLGRLCNDAHLNVNENQWLLLGNPVDGALLALALKARLKPPRTRAGFRLKEIIPFNSDQKLMACAMYHENDELYWGLKGAPEKILFRCQYQVSDLGVGKINKEFWLSAISEFAKQGMRVIGLAYKKQGDPKEILRFDNLGNDYCMLGVIGIIDPPREEVIDAIKACHTAGIDVKMITGDHKLTAKAIAVKVGIPVQHVISGAEIDSLDDLALAQQVNTTNVFTRTVPEHKVRILNALKNQNKVVAMTGDGVNDAPALQSAHVGIAMGIKGTDVAKEASEIVLADDNFATIEKAVDEGRGVYDKIKRALLFILPTNAAEGLIVSLSILLGYTLPISPIQILWVNMVTAVTLALSLAFESNDKNLMNKKPRKHDEPLLSKFLVWRIVYISILFSACMFGLFLFETSQGVPITYARTVVVNTLVLLECAYLINCRQITATSLTMTSLFGSKAMLISIASVMAMQLSFTYLPWMQYMFATKAISWLDGMYILVISIMAFFMVEGEKKIMRWLK